MARFRRLVDDHTSNISIEPYRTPSSCCPECLPEIRDGRSTGLEVYPQMSVNTRKCSHGDASRYGMFGDDKPSRLERSTVSGILGLTLLSGGFSNGLVDCFGRDIECSAQSIDQPPSSMYVAGQ